MNGRREPPRWRLLLALLLLLGMAGCGPQSGGETGSVSGRVTRGGKPVAFGGVVMTPDGRQPVGSKLDADGRYVIHGVPVGQVPVAVMSPPPNLTPKKSKGETPPKPTGSALPRVEVPKRYESAETSGLTATIRPGDNTFDIMLDP